MMAFWPHLLLLALVAVLFVWERESSCRGAT